MKHIIRQAVSGVAAIIFLALSFAVAVLLGWSGDLIGLLHESSTRELNGTVSLAILAAALFVGFQQLMLRVVIFRK